MGMARIRGKSLERQVKMYPGIVKRKPGERLIFPFRFSPVLKRVCGLEQEASNILKVNEHIWTALFETNGDSPPEREDYIIASYDGKNCYKYKIIDILKDEKTFIVESMGKSKIGDIKFEISFER